LRERISVADRYGVDPGRLKGQKSIIEFFQDAFRRIESGESSLQIGHTAVEDGDLTIRNGDLLVSESDNSVVLRLMHGSVPELRMFPLGETDSHRIALFGADFNLDQGAGPDQSVQLCVETVDAIQDGGKVLLTRNNAIFSHQPAAGDESFLWLNAPASSTQEAVYRGKWTNQWQFDNQMGIYPGVIVVGSGFTSWTHSYFTSFATTVGPVVGLVNSAAISWCIQGFSTAAFTVIWSGTAAKTIAFWNFRIA